MISSKKQKPGADYRRIDQQGKVVLEVAGGGSLSFRTEEQSDLAESHRCSDRKSLSDRGRQPDLVCMFLADLHSAYKSYPRIIAETARCAELYRDCPLVFLVNGDLFESGVAAAARSHGMLDLEFLRRLAEYGKVVFNIGNHDFDFHSSSEFVHAARGAGVTVIGTVAAEGREAAVSAHVSLSISSYTDITAAGRTIRIAGIACNNASIYQIRESDALTIPDPVRWMDNHWEAVTREADFSILLSHSGLADDVRILKIMQPELRPLFAVGSHDHLHLYTILHGTPYLHTGFRGEHTATVEIYFDEAAERIGRMVWIDKLTDELDGTDKHMQTLTAQTERRYLTADDLIPIGNIGKRMSVLEAVFWALSVLKEVVGSDAVFLNHTSFGSGFDHPVVTRTKFNEFIRFDNALMRSKISREELNSIILRCNQHTVSAADKRTGDFLYTLPVSMDDCRSYTIITTDWVAMEINQMRYLGRRLKFETIPDITLKGVLAAFLQRRKDIAGL